MGGDPLQDLVQILQGVSVHQSPPGWVALTQVVSMLQAHPPAWAAVALQPADVRVQVADCTLCLVFVIFVEALGGICAT